MTFDVKKWRKENGLTQEQLAMQLGITRQLLGAIENGQPMSKTVEKLFNTLKNAGQISNTVQESQAKYERTSHIFTESPEEKIINDFKALKSIAESNRILAESQKIAAESNKILAESQRQLVNTNAELVNLYKEKSTGNAGQGNAADVEAKFDVLLEAIAEVASGKKYHSKQEAVATLGKRFYARSGS